MSYYGSPWAGLAAGLAHGLKSGVESYSAADENRRAELMERQRQSKTDAQSKANLALQMGDEGGFNQAYGAAYGQAPEYRNKIQEMFGGLVPQQTPTQTAAKPAMQQVPPQPAMTAAGSKGAMLPQGATFEGLVAPDPNPAPQQAPVAMGGASGYFQRQREDRQAVLADRERAKAAEARSVEQAAYEKQYNQFKTALDTNDFDSAAVLAQKLGIPFDPVAASREWSLKQMQAQTQAGHYATQDEVSRRTIAAQEAEAKSQDAKRKAEIVALMKKDPNRFEVNNGVMFDKVSGKYQVLPQQDVANQVLMPDGMGGLKLVTVMAPKGAKVMAGPYEHRSPDDVRSDNDAKFRQKLATDAIANIRTNGTSANPIPHEPTASELRGIQARYGADLGAGKSLAEQFMESQQGGQTVDLQNQQPGKTRLMPAPAAKKKTMPRLRTQEEWIAEGKGAPKRKPATGMRH